MAMSEKSELEEAKKENTEPQAFKSGSALPTVSEDLPAVKKSPFDLPSLNKA